ncbi:zinc finger, CCHC-type containing protein [Tanacetum coccineum]
MELWPFNVIEGSSEKPSVVKYVVLAVHAYFNNQLREATKEARTLAGFNVSRLLNEPATTAIAYGGRNSLRVVVAIMVLKGSGKRQAGWTLEDSRRRCTSCFSARVVYVLTTLIPEDDGDDATVEQIKKRAKWDNDDYVCRGLILKDFKHTLKHNKEELTLVELGSHLRTEESLRAQDNDKPKGNNVVGP